MPDSFCGKLHFAGTFAFLQLDSGASAPLLQHDNSRKFNLVAAQTTSLDLQSDHQEGDRVGLEGTLATVDVNGRPTSVLFYQQEGACQD